ncbi:hypothetical protein [Ferruginibacter sp.]|uniref:hypothetical protein n=1 Tax=Ferruginibacter sp. TaxID=1940288 RepID=UPI0019C0D0E6|nr:hypothetical protein [Ferruginibacter sp.]MBC7625775.1 hypothetical protein [Ferruginibacter sp.]
MERIIIEVGDATAKRWRTSSRKRREEISQEIEIRLAKKLMADSKENFIEFLDEVGETMRQRGLTEEILNEILNEDE